MRKSIVSVMLMLALCAIATVPALATQIERQVVASTGSNSMASTSLGLTCTVGQATTGMQGSTNLFCIAGFWQDFGPGDGASCCAGLVGDANNSGDSEPTIGDISTMIDAKFISNTCGPFPGPTDPFLIECLLEADINQSGGMDPTCDDLSIGDISTLVDYLFITGPSTFGPLADCL